MDKFIYNKKEIDHKSNHHKLCFSPLYYFDYIHIVKIIYENKMVALLNKIEPNTTRKIVTKKYIYKYRKYNYMLYQVIIKSDREEHDIFLKKKISYSLINKLKSIKPKPSPKVVFFKGICNRLNISELTKESYMYIFKNGFKWFKEPLFQRKYTNR